MKLLEFLVSKIRDWRARQSREKLADEAMCRQLDRLTEDGYLDKFSGGSRG